MSPFRDNVGRRALVTIRRDLRQGDRTPQPRPFSTPADGGVRARSFIGWIDATGSRRARKQALGSGSPLRFLARVWMKTSVRNGFPGGPRDAVGTALRLGRREGGPGPARRRVPRSRQARPVVSCGLGRFATEAPTYTSWHRSPEILLKPVLKTVISMPD